MAAHRSLGLNRRGQLLRAAASVGAVVSLAVAVLGLCVGRRLTRWASVQKQQRAMVPPLGHEVRADPLRVITHTGDTADAGPATDRAPAPTPTTLTRPHVLSSGTVARNAPGRTIPRLLWLAAFTGAMAVPLLLAALDPAGPPRSFVLELGSALGIAALGLLAVQLALPARVPLLTTIGAEVAVRLHRHTADILLAVVVAHVAAVMVADPARVELLRFFGQPWRAQAALGSVAALGVIFVTSLARRRIHLSYARWRGIHLALGAAALVLGIAHTVGVGRYLVQPPAVWSLVALAVVGLGALLMTRSQRLRHRTLRPYRVRSVRPEQGGAITVDLEADGHAGQPFLPGQFAWLKEPGWRHLLEEHPFSYSSGAGNPAHPGFTLQPRSGFSARAARLQPGRKLLVDGPHGAFRPQPDARGTVLVSGGIGITPSMSILRTAAQRRDPRPHVLLYGGRTLASLPFLEELTTLAGSIALTTTICLSAPEEGWTGERGRIDAAVLDRHLPHDLRGWQFMTCGAPSFVDAILDAFEEVGVPGERVHAERFVEV